MLTDPGRPFGNVERFIDLCSVLKNLFDCGMEPYYVCLLTGIPHSYVAKMLRYLGYSHKVRRGNLRKAIRKRLTKSQKVQTVMMHEMGYNHVEMTECLGIEDVNAIVEFLLESDTSFGARKCFGCGEPFVWLENEKRTCAKCDVARKRLSRGSFSEVNADIPINRLL